MNKKVYKTKINPKKSQTVLRKYKLLITKQKFVF